MHGEYFTIERATNPVAYVSETLKENVEGKETGSYRVAADAVGAGLGEVVLYATGSAARQTEMTHQRPCDGVIMAIVDLLEVDGDVIYDKSEVG